MIRSLAAFALLATTLPSAALALPDRWSSGFNQGILEYSVGPFGPEASNLILSCKGSELDIAVAIGGVAPPSNSLITYKVGRLTETIRVGKDGWARFRNAYREPQIQRLWAAFRSGATATVIYPGGASHAFPLRDSGKVMSASVCAP
ncbi:hypothetical protein PQ455_12145 [Sphingomonas naphthae]|uniref:Uncharacterized protein n=1 Tax=Sphingomonas naphthae TaxID=1813468 RepID=A0ABY7TI34_9SPHN|nr:hypothetical protein [Sphingomonas naphthae]WCT72387.1 hypothetical protein PQ455_12145 [Sphingomonas naphthae]